MGFATAPADPEAGSVYDIPIGSPQRDTRASREAFLERGGKDEMFEGICLWRSMRLIETCSLSCTRTADGGTQHT